jgi:hypothetical protein
MASELAKKIYQLEWGQIDVIDAELQEVREVLRGLSTYTTSPCYCARPPLSVDGEHEAVCQRARALMEKLEVRP